MPKVHLNTFTGGMNKDAAKTVQRNETYEDALNVRIVTDSGGSLGALITVKGNSKLLDIPDAANVYEAEYTGGAFPITGFSGFIINGTSVQVSRTGKSLAVFLEDLSEAMNVNPTLLSLGIKTAVRDGIIVIGSSKFLVIAPVNIGAATDFAFTQRIGVQTNLSPIGGGRIREKLYVLTTNSDQGGPGQVFEVVFDEGSNTASITQVYNGDLNFARAHLIGDEVVGKYETQNIQRIYWTDFNSPIRRLNVADPGAFAVPPNDTLINAPTRLEEIKIISEDVGGALLSGVYYYTYKLKSGAGKTTVYAPITGPMNIIIPSKALNFRDIDTSAGNIATSKKVDLRISGIDQNYETIEVVYLRRTSLGGALAISRFFEEKIEGRTVINLSHFGNETLDEPVEFQEILAADNVVDIARTMGAKDNLLFIGNVKSKSLNLEEFGFDTKIQRYKRSTGASAFTIDQVTSLRTIQSSSEFFYQADLQTIGGGDPSAFGISFKIKTLEFVLDDQTTLNTGSPGNWRAVNNETGQILPSLDPDIQLDNQKKDFRSPMRALYTRGYMNGEYYRFGIEFYDKRMNPIFTEWMMDLKFPEIYETDFTNTADFRPTDLDAQGRAIGRITYPEFKINLPQALKSAIGGYSIVRVKRDESNKTILGQGILNAIDEVDPSNNEFAYVVSQLGNGGPFLNYTYTSTDNKLGSFDSADFIFNKNKIYQQGDSFKVIGILNSSNPGTGTGLHYASNIPVSGSGVPTVQSIQIAKFPKIDTASIRTDSWPRTGAVLTGSDGRQNIMTIKELSNILPGNNLTLTSGRKIANYEDSSIGNDSYFYELDTTIPTHSSFGITVGTQVPKKFFVNYTRSRPNQYGGFTSTDRSRNKYISCGHFTQPENSNVPEAVFGGDTFTNYWFFVKIYKDWDDDDSNNTPGDMTFIMFGLPCQASVNTEMRYGTRPITSLIADNGTSTASGFLDPAIDYPAGVEQFLTHTVYHSENDIVDKFPRPFDFKDEEEFDSRVHFSDEKINGESSDSWSIFRTNNFRDVDGEHGPITKIVELQDNLYVFQPRAFSGLSINPVAAAPTSAGQLVLGTGAVIQDHNYISTQYGCSHQWGITAGDKAIYWIDTIHKKLFRFAQDGNTPLSDVAGLSGYLEANLDGIVETEDSPLLNNGISAVFDHRYQEAVFTVKNGSKKFTIAYNEISRAFSSFYSFTPYMYINMGSRIITPNPTNNKELYTQNSGQYNRFYGIIYPTTLRLIHNSEPLDTKVFDNLSYHSEVIDINTGVNILSETLQAIKCRTDYQNSGTVLLSSSTNLKRREREWTLTVPRNAVKLALTGDPDINLPGNLDQTREPKERLRDKYMISDFSYQPTTNRKLVLHYIKTLYRTSQR